MGSKVIILIENLLCARHSVDCWVTKVDGMVFSQISWVQAIET